MKIGFLTSHRGQKQFESEYWQIISFLQKKGHDVVHSMETKIEDIAKLPYIERERIFHEFFQSLESCDLVLAECSIQSTQVGFGLAYLRDRGKPIIISSEKGSQGEFSPQGDVYSEVENMMVVEYEKHNMLTVIKDAIELMEGRLDKRFTMIFPAYLMAQLDEHSRKKRLPKAVYIRQVLERTIKEETATQ